MFIYTKEICKNLSERYSDKATKNSIDLVEEYLIFSALNPIVQHMNVPQLRNLSTNYLISKGIMTATYYGLALSSKFCYDYFDSVDMESEVKPIGDILPIEEI